MVWPWKQGYGSFKVIGNGTIWYIAYEFLFAFHIVTMALSSARYSDSLVENREIFISHLYLAPPQGGDSVGISWRRLMLIKLEWFGYRMVKNYDNMLSRFHLIPERHGQTNRQTDRRTELLYQYRASVCLRAIKIGQYLQKLCSNKKWPSFLIHSVYACIPCTPGHHFEHLLDSRLL